MRPLSYDLLKSSAFLLLLFTWVPWSTIMICSGKYVPLIAYFHHSMCLAKAYALHFQMWECFRQREQYNSWNLFLTTQAPDYICELSVQPQAQHCENPPASFLSLSSHFWNRLRGPALLSPGRIFSYLLGVCMRSVITLSVRRNVVWRSTRVCKEATKNLSSKQSQMLREYKVWYL